MDEDVSPLDVLEAAIEQDRTGRLAQDDTITEELRNIYIGHINGYHAVLAMIDRMRKGLPPLKEEGTEQHV